MPAGEMPMPRMPRMPCQPLTAEQQKLVEDNVGLAYNLVTKFRIPQAYHDDAVSDAMLALVHAARGFKADKISGFGAFAYLCIERRLKCLYNRIIKRESRRAADATVRDDNRPENDGTPLWEQSYTPVLPEPDETISRKPECIRAFGDMGDEVARLPRLLRRVVVLYFGKGMNLVEVAERLGVGFDVARERLQLAKWLLRKRMKPPQPEHPWSVADKERAVEVAATPPGDSRQMAALRMAYATGRDYCEVVALARSLRERVRARNRSKANLEPEPMIQKRT